MDTSQKAFLQTVGKFVAQRIAEGLMPLSAQIDQLKSEVRELKSQVCELQEGGIKYCGGINAHPPTNAAIVLRLTDQCGLPSGQLNQWKSLGKRLAGSFLSNTGAMPMREQTQHDQHRPVYRQGNR